MVAPFITSLALVLSIAVAVTAVTIGIARAGDLAAADPHARLATGVLFALALGGLGGLTAFLCRGDAKAG